MKNWTFDWDEVRENWPKKFKDERYIFEEISPGDRIFIGTGCAEPQHLVEVLLNYIKKDPKGQCNESSVN